MAKKQSERELQDEIRQNLESLLGDDDPVRSTAATAANAAQPLAIDGGTDLGDKLQHPHAQPTDFHQKRKEATMEARKTLKSLMDFYLSANIIKKNEYARYRKRADELSLSNMMFLIETSQTAIIKLLEEIDMGNTHPRNFEALATLNGQMMNMIKHQQSLFITVEESYKKLRRDHETMEAENRTEDAAAEDVTILDGAFKARGTKMLMANLQKTIKAEAQDAQEETTTPRLTDAFNRPENTVPNSISSKKLGDDSDEIYGELDEHF